MNEMERSDHKLTQYAATPDRWPTGLKTASEVAHEIRISEVRLLELAESGFAPHWRIDGSEPLFRLQDLKEWGVRNLALKSDGRPLPVEIRVTMSANTSPAVDAPASIRDIPGLLEIPVGYPCGVYFLTLDGEVVYVGQSISPVNRISGHVFAQKKEFSRAYLVPVPASQLNAVESALIRLLKPRMNSGNPVINSASMDDVKVIEEFCPGVQTLAQEMERRRAEKDDARATEIQNRRPPERGEG